VVRAQAEKDKGDVAAKKAADAAAEAQRALHEVATIKEAMQQERMAADQELASLQQRVTAQRIELQTQTLSELPQIFALLPCSNN